MLVDDVWSDLKLNNIVNNGYPVEKIVMGMLTGQDFENIQNELKKMIYKYQNNFGGVFIWEFYDAPPSGITDPSNWAKIIHSIIHPKLFVNNTINFNYFSNIISNLWQ